jgi:c-di-GMP-related signal transduction protein
LEVFVARQPILTRKQEIFGYELLYRNNQQVNKFSDADSDFATSEVINSLLQIGVEDLSEGKPFFINFTENLLHDTFPSFLKPELMVIEILETVNPTRKVIENIKLLKTQGYKIALDDFEWREDNQDFRELINLADIVKIDIRKTNRKEQLKIMEKLKEHEVVFLAEKVETLEEYNQCLQDNYTYFQGYFFSEPIILSSSDIPFLTHNLFMITSELSKEEPDIERITKIIESDVSLSYKLLRLLNSPATGLLHKIKSIKQAIVLLGLTELKKWVFVLSFRDHIEKSEQVMFEVIKLSLTRAKANELISLKIGRTKDCSSLFLTGLFSLIETIFKQPKELILNKLPLDQIIVDTLGGKETSLTPITKLVYAAEKGNWDEMDKFLKEFDISIEDFNDLYHQAVKWSRDVVDGSDTGY